MEQSDEHAREQEPEDREPAGPDLSGLPEVIGFEVTRILESARIAAEQIRAQAREEAARAQEESAEVRRKIATLRAEFAGLLQDMGRFTEAAEPVEPVEPAPAQMVVMPEPIEMQDLPEIALEGPAPVEPGDGQVLGDERHTAATAQEVEATFWAESEHEDGLTVLERLRRLAAN